MKIATILMLLELISLVARADNPSLLLVVDQTTIKPNSKVIFQVYLCNTSSKAVRVPSLDLITISSWARKVKDIASPTSGSAAAEREMSTNPPVDHILAGNALETRRLERRISAQPGDLVEVCALAGQKQALRSNSVLLFCPPN